MPSFVALEELTAGSGAAAAPGPLMAAATTTPVAANPVVTVFQAFVTTVLSFRRRLDARLGSVVTYSFGARTGFLTPKPASLTRPGENPRGR